MLVAQQFYLLTCDFEGCTARSPSVGADIAAWADPQTTLDLARDDDWLISDDDHHYCAEHVMWCAECENELIIYSTKIKICDDCREANTRKESA